MIRTLIIILISSISLLPLKAQDFQVVTGKSVTLNGKTSLGRFACNYQTTEETDTIFLKAAVARQGVVLDISLPIDDFGCGNRMLNRDFNKTLQAEEFPFIHVTVERFYKEGDHYFSALRLRLVGKELYMDKLPFIMEESADEKSLIAEFELSLKYFDLDPPKKLLGLLKVQEELEIRLKLTLAE